MFLGLDIKGTLWALAVVLLLLYLLMRGCGGRMDKFREHREQKQEERQEKWDERREERQRWREGRERKFFNRRLTEESDL